MVKSFMSELYGLIEYEESSWTGKKKVKVNGAELKPLDKTSFMLEHKSTMITVKVVGNFFKGAILQIGDEEYEISPKSLWYEYVLALLPFIFVMIWGNSAVLCSIIPVLGGAISGGISGALGIVSMSKMKTTTNPLVKVAYGLVFILITIVICAALGYAILGA